MKTNSRKNTIPKILNSAGSGILLAVLAAISAQSQTNPPAIQWQQSFGGSRGDDLHSVQQTSDGGYILSGDSLSDVSGNRTSAGYGSRDIWIVKVDANGSKAWEQSFGGSGLDWLPKLQQTSDGGYMLLGTSSSGISGNKTSTNYGASDVWVVKIDGNGNKVWDKSFGGSSNDNSGNFRQTSDGGYVLAGYSNSGVSGNKTNAGYGGFDYWVVKIDADGNKVWDKSFGGSADETLLVATLLPPPPFLPTIDGGYILGGTSMSGVSGNKTSAHYGGTDAWIVKIDADGNKVWDKSFGGSADETVFLLKQTSDGGYILGGQSASDVSGNKSSAGYGGIDLWVVKMDADGNKVWDKTFGANTDDYLRSVMQTGDGGYILGGSSVFGVSGNKTNAGIGLVDFWVVKIDANGNKVWDKSFGREGYDWLSILHQTSDGGYVAGGYSAFGSDYGPYDYYVVKMDVNGNKVWDKFIGGSNSDALFCLEKTSDGGLILGGNSDSGISGDKTGAAYGLDDYWVVKLAGPAAPVFQLPTVTNGVFRANLLGDAGAVYRIDGTTNFTDWVELACNTNSGAPFLFTDNASTNLSKRFYRAMVLP